MYRKDIDKNELQSFMSGANDNFTVWREFNGTKPHHWVLWPYSASKGWLERTVVNRYQK